MASSIIGRPIATDYPAEYICASAPSKKNIEALQNTFAITTHHNNKDALEGADVVVLAVKPQLMAEVCKEIGPLLEDNALVISIAAGISCEALGRWLGGNRAIVRCMPNTPALVQEGASGMYANAQVSTNQRESASEIMGAVGLVTWVAEETLIDSVTAISGSGPAYFFLFMESMIAEGVKQGLSHSAASELAIQTALGAAQLAKSSSDGVTELRRKVTSPNGTTERAIQSFEKNDLGSIVSDAMSACLLRARSLAKELEK